MSFVEKLSEESLAAFTVASQKPFSQQAQFFLNAFWDEYGVDHAEWIYTVGWECIKKADQTWKGTKYIHLYEEGNDLDFDMGLHLFELLCNFKNDDKNAKWVEEHKVCFPEEATAVSRKKELRDKVDVNFDGRVSFLEYLLYQFNASPKDLMDRSMGNDMPEEVLKALAALEEVNRRVREYETEKTRLEELAEAAGVKGLKAKNELAQLNSSPLWEEINKALITAEAAVRIAKRKYGAGGEFYGQGAGGAALRTNGTMWWMDRELRTKQELYGGRK